MVKKKLIGAAGRFGARYGQRVKRKIADIESKQRKKQKCPFCNKTVKRVSMGIWQCKKCKKKFAAHAYYLDESLKVKKPEKQEKPKPTTSNSKPSKAPSKTKKIPIKDKKSTKKTKTIEKPKTKKSKNKK